MNNKVRHLEFIQAVINRMAGNLFYLRGWTVTLLAAILALSVDRPTYVVVAYFPIAVFWLLDGFFLSQERLFRALYDDVRTRNEDAIDFSMNTRPFATDQRTWIHSVFSRTLLVFYVPLWAMVITVHLLNR